MWFQRSQNVAINIDEIIYIRDGHNEPAFARMAVT